MSSKFKVQSSKFKAVGVEERLPASTLSLELGTLLLDGREDCGRVVCDAEGDACARAEACETFDAGGVEAKARGLDLHAESELAERLGAERRGLAARVGATVDLCGDVDRLVDAEYAGQPVEKHVVLREELRRRGVDSDAEVAEGVHAPGVAELLAEQYRAVGVRLVHADAARLVRVRKLDAEAEAEGGAAARLVAKLDLGREAEVARVVRRGRARRDLQGEGRCPARVDAQEILRHALDRELHVRRQPHVHAYDADTRQVARQP